MINHNLSSQAAQKTTCLTHNKKNTNNSHPSAPYPEYISRLTENIHILSVCADYPQISGDEQKEDADFPSYDGKKESTNITYYRDINEVRVVTDNVSGAMGQGLHPEEYRLKMYETQYSRPTFAMKTTLDGAPRTLTLHREPTTNKIMKINGYLYNVVEDVTETNLIEVKHDD